MSAEVNASNAAVFEAPAEASDRPVGVFDSGVGGLTVMREIMKLMPKERIIYFGDTARVPYGNKSGETVTRFSEQIMRFLLKEDVKAIVVACNTASAYALEALERDCPVPIIGVIVPGAAAAVKATRNGRIGVIATAGTIASGIYPREIGKLNPDSRVLGKACPLFVPLVEEGLWQDPVTREIARRYLEELMNEDIDTLILGCTHYPLIQGVIGEVAGAGVTLVNPAYETARQLGILLRERELLSPEAPGLGNEPQYRFYVSDMAEQFKSFANAIIPYGILTAKKIDIERY